MVNNIPSGSEILTMDQLEKGLGRLPVLSSTISKVLDLASRADVHTAMLARTIELDVGLSARLLRLANSPFFGLPGEIASVKQACVVLGLHTVRNLAVAAGVSECFSSQKGGVLNRRTLWSHSVEVALAAQILAQRCKVDADIAFTAGLLHDLGKLALDACFPEIVARIPAYGELHGADVLETERAVIGMEHCQVGALIAQRWGLPAQVQQAIANHHVFEGAGCGPLADIVCLSNIVVYTPISDAATDAGVTLPPQIIQRLGLTTNDVDAWQMDVAAARSMSDTLASA